MEIKKIGVVGLGYVGLPLAISFAEKYSVTGYDINRRIVESCRRGFDPTGEVGESALKQTTMVFTTQERCLEEADIIIIAVPTPVDRNKKPDFRPLIEASVIAGRNMKRGTIVVYESTVYPGATEEIAIPALEKASGLTCEIDFKVGYSPERINPGDQMHALKHVVKIVAATSDEALEIISSMYESIVLAGIYRVSSIRIAEAAKIIENAQRDVNIAFMNEMAMLLNKMDINSEDVFQAASTKWNFLNFKPGLVGGHCISVDPYYLIEKGSREGFDLSVIKTARERNEGMTAWVADRILGQLCRMDDTAGKRKVAILGVTFKENVADIRNSKPLELAEILEKRGVEVILSDPRADGLSGLTDINKIRDVDLLVFAVAHEEYRKLPGEDIRKMFRKGRNRVFDLMNLFNKEELEVYGLERVGF